MLPVQCKKVKQLEIYKKTINLKLTVSNFKIMFALLFSTPEFRNAFLKTIRQIIRDSVRRMSLPSTMTTTAVTTVISSGASYNNRGSSNNKRGKFKGLLRKLNIRF